MGSWRPVKGGLQSAGQANYSPDTTEILPVCPSAFLRSVGLHQILLSSGTAAKISRPELITTNHRDKRRLSSSTKHKWIIRNYGPLIIKAALQVADAILTIWLTAHRGRTIPQSRVVQQSITHLREHRGFILLMSELVSKELTLSI